MQCPVDVYDSSSNGNNSNNNDYDNTNNYNNNEHCNAPVAVQKAAHGTVKQH